MERYRDRIKHLEELQKEADLLKIAYDTIRNENLHFTIEQTIRQVQSKMNKIGMVLTTDQIVSRLYKGGYSLKRNKKTN